MNRPLLAAALAVGLATGASAANAQATPMPSSDGCAPSVAPPAPWMGPDGIPVASYADVDARPLDRRARSELEAAAPDLRIAALLAVAAPPSPSLRILMPREPAAASAPRHLTVVAENLADDAVASVLTQLVFDRRADGRWTIVSARQALLCRRGEVTDRFVKGPCP